MMMIMIASSAVPGAFGGVAALASLAAAETLLLTASLAFLGGFITALLLNRLATRRLARTATALAAHAAEILEETVNQTWNAQRTAAATANATERIDSVIEAETEESAEALDRLAGQARALGDPDAPELASSLHGVASRIQTVARIRDTGLASIRDSLERIEGMMKRTTKSTRRLERIARALNQRGLSLLEFARRLPFRWTGHPSGETSRGARLDPLTESGSAGGRASRS